MSKDLENAFHPVNTQHALYCALSNIQFLYEQRARLSRARTSTLRRIWARAGVYLDWLEENAVDAIELSDQVLDQGGDQGGDQGK